MLENLQEWTKNNLVEKIIDFLPHLLLAIIILGVGFWLSNLVGKLVVKTLKNRNVDPTIYPFAARVISLLLKFGVIISALSTLGINLNSFIAAIGAAGVTAGVGLKDSVAQFASGFQILLNKPFKSGDYVELENVSGTVVEIRIMDTVLKTIDNKRIIIPNSHITSNNIINYTAAETRRLDLVFSISYDDDIFKAKDVLLKVAASHDICHKDPAPFVAVKEHGDSGVALVLQMWCDSDKYWDLYYSVQERVKLAFDENGITIPYNHLDVKLAK